MLQDINGNLQPAFGTQTHWGLLRAVIAVPAIFNPLNVEVVRQVTAAITANPTQPSISSRQAGAEALNLLGSAWHAQFARHFPVFPNGAAAGVFGMALWHYLVGHPDRWCFLAVADPYGFGYDSTSYWRL